MSKQNVANAAAGGTITLATNAETSFPTITGGAVRTYTSLFRNNPVPKGIAEGKLFTLKFAYAYVRGTTTNVSTSIRFYSGGNTNLTTFTSDTAILAAITDASTTGNGKVFGHIDFTWDSISTRLEGMYSMTWQTAVPLHQRLVALSATATSTLANIAFCITTTFSTGNAGNTATLLYLYIDEL